MYRRGWVRLKHAPTRRSIKNIDEALSRIFSEKTDALLRVSLGFFFFLYYLDALTTVLLLRLFPNTFECNSLFAPLLAGAFTEVAAALLLKLVLIGPLVAVIAWPLTSTRSNPRVKALKLGAFAAIIALMPLMTWVALGNNLFSLVRLALAFRAA